MSTKRKKQPPSKRKTRKPEDPYPSLRQGPTPAERLAALLAEPRNAAAKAWSEEEFDKMMEGPSDWPDECGTIDEFLEWLYKMRREGR